MRTSAPILLVSASIGSALFLSTRSSPVESGIKPKASAEVEQIPKVPSVVDPEPFAAELGTRANPFPTGATGRHSADSMKILSVGETKTDAWSEIAPAPQLKEASGRRYVRFTISVVLPAPGNVHHIKVTFCRSQVEYVLQRPHGINHVLRET